MFTAVIM